ncbi:hypothetical protein CLAIMM_07868 [Cladophialophora immunda]|nr:hypothetical protein CLAIMM_07868 [Cladophialophora immunda]
MSQEEILDLLSKKHGHNAKLNMLKTRLKQWNIKKNYTKAEKQAAAKELKRCSDLGLNPLVEMEIDGRLPSWDRVYRQCRNDAEYTSPWLQKNTQWRAVVSRLCLKTSPTDHFIEVTLRQVSTYWGTIIVERERKLETKRYEPHALRIGFLAALRLINKGHDEQGWREIHDTCGKVINIFRSREPDLLSELVSLFSARTWTIHPQLFFAIAKYLLGASRDLVGSEHPLSHILSAFVALLAENNLEAFGLVPELALKVMLDLAEKEREKVKLESFYIHSLEVDLINKISRRLGQHAVRQLVQTKFSHYRATLGERNMHTLSMLLDLAEMHLVDARVFDPREKKNEKEAAERKAEKILLKIVHQGEKFPDDLYRVGGYLVAAQDLARLYFAKQDFQSAHKYYRLAVLWSAQKLGKSHSFTSLLLNEYKALQKLVELGLVDIEMPQIEKQDPCMKKGPGPLYQDMEVLEVPCNEQSESSETFESHPLVEDAFVPPTEPYFPSDCAACEMYDGCMEVNAGNTFTGPISSEFLDSYLDNPDEESGGQYVQEAYGCGAGGHDTPAPDFSPDLTTGMVFDGPPATSTPDLPSLPQDYFAECDLQMDDIDELLGCTGDPKALILDEWFGIGG